MLLYTVKNKLKSEAVCPIHAEPTHISLKGLLHRDDGVGSRRRHEASVGQVPRFLPFRSELVHLRPGVGIETGERMKDFAGTKITPIPPPNSWSCSIQLSLR